MHDFTNTLAECVYMSTLELVLFYVFSCIWLLHISFLACCSGCQCVCERLSSKSIYVYVYSICTRPTFFSITPAKVNALPVSDLQCINFSRRVRLLNALTTNPCALLFSISIIVCWFIFMSVCWVCQCIGARSCFTYISYIGLVQTLLLFRSSSFSLSFFRVCSMSLCSTAANWHCDCDC